MKKHYLPPIVITVLLCTSPGAADTKSTVYAKAVERGDYAAALETQSYLAPVYCYDLNKCHGITFTKMINGRAYTPAFPFI